MNKYIRTKDEIFRIEKNIYNKVFAVNSKREWQEFEYIEKDIIKEADTIEELCDEFVYVNKSTNSKTVYAGFVAFQISTMTKIAKEIESDLYGAIWTESGLIYVAKMNDKGELELI